MLREKRRIAFFGGTFDPFHSGHLEMARAARDHLRLQRVYFVPAQQNPHKDQGPQVSNPQRIEMIRLGTHGEPSFEIWDGELDRDGPSYTLHSIQHIERVYPNSHLFWIIGYDQLPGLANWYGIETLVQKIGFILVRRPGYELTWPSIPGLTVYPVDNPMINVSATEIRQRAFNGETLKGMVPLDVESYILKNGLYR